MWKCSCSKQKTKPAHRQTCFTLLSCKRRLLTTHFQQTTAFDVLWTKKAFFSRSGEVKSYGDGWKQRESTEWAGRAGALLTTWKREPKSFTISFLWKWSTHVGHVNKTDSHLEKQWGYKGTWKATTVCQLRAQPMPRGRPTSSPTARLEMQWGFNWTP